MAAGPDENDSNSGSSEKGLGGKRKAVPATIVELLPSATYRVKLENEQLMTAHAAGPAMTNFIRLRPGDRVEVEISPFDRTRGRILRTLAKE